MQNRLHETAFIKAELIVIKIYYPHRQMLHCVILLLNSFMPIMESRCSTLQLKEFAYANAFIIIRFEIRNVTKIYDFSK